MAFIALGTLALIQPGIQSQANGINNIASKDVKQFIKESGKSDISQKSKSLEASIQTGNQTIQINSPNYMIKTDSFLDGIITNNSYVITVSEFLEKSKADPNWVVVDIRPAEKYAEGHVDKAINVPFSDLQPMMGTIFPDKDLAVYGDNNIDSAYGVMALRILGNRSAWVLSDGITAWEAAGMPVVTEKKA